MKLPICFNNCFWMWLSSSRGFLVMILRSCVRNIEAERPHLLSSQETSPFRLKQNPTTMMSGLNWGIVLKYNFFLFSSNSSQLLHSLSQLLKDKGPVHLSSTEQYWTLGLNIHGCSSTTSFVPSHHTTDFVYFSCKVCLICACLVMWSGTCQTLIRGTVWVHRQYKLLLRSGFGQKQWL